jgi:hypothetical protein
MIWRSVPSAALSGSKIENGERVLAIPDLEVFT